MRRTLPFRLAITGPESSGKSTLSSALATALGGVRVPEQSRNYFRYRPYAHHTAADILRIGALQRAAEDRLSAQTTRYLVCDTDVLVCKVWHEYRYGYSHPVLDTWWQEHRYHLYVLCTPDLPWEPDPLRLHPHERDVLFKHYLHHLQQQKQVPVVVVRGRLHTERLRQALHAVGRHLH